MADLGNNQAAAQAFVRFGLCGRPEDPVPTDVTGWLLNQLNGPDPMNQSGLPTRATCMKAIQTFQVARPGSAAQKHAANVITGILNQEIQAHLANAVLTTVPFRERLVWFWANHFAIMGGSYNPAALAGVFVREAIRPNVNGTFTDMLQAVMQHPAMIYSLNNDLSIGPDSQYAIQHDQHQATPLGINENLGRELLELHTVGVDAGYTQADVDAMAYILTGWTVDVTTGVGFYYDASKHQPGNQTVMGHVTSPTFGGGMGTLAFLATHPDTYQHLATKLVTHFVSDTPDPNDVATVANALSASGGDLVQATTALVGLSNAWTPGTKFRNPLDHTIGLLRAVGTTSSTMPTINTILEWLGQPTWTPPFPNGWSDLMADWLCPAQMVLRTDWVNSISNTLSALDPNAIASSALGPFLAPLTAQLMAQLSSKRDQFTVLFTSPEFQRR